MEEKIQRDPKERNGPVRSSTCFLKDIMRHQINKYQIGTDQKQPLLVWRENIDTRGTW